jgi:zinc protease
MTVLSVRCRGQSGSAILKTDAALVKGTLQNGVSFYIRNIPELKDQVRIQLAVKVGNGNESAHETEFAHLIEHLAFEGTEHFPGDSVKQFFAAKGLVWGNDVNAYTSVFNTGYFLNLHASDTSLLKECFVIVHDWMHHLSFDSLRIKAQIGAVLGELRMKGETLTSRIIYEKNSRVLGIPDYGKKYRDKARQSLINCSRNDLLKFYNRWYTPSLQAIIVVGDLDVDFVKNKIEQYFSDLQDRVPKIRAKQSAHYSAQGVFDNRVIKVIYPDILVPSLEVYFKQRTKSNQFKTRADYNLYILEDLTDRLLQKRFSTLPKAYGKVDINASFQRNMSDSEIDGIVLNADLRDVRSIAECYKDMMSTFQKVVELGFSKDEFRLAKEALGQSITSVDPLAIQNISERYRNSYVNGVSVPDPGEEAILMSHLLDDASLADVNSFVKQWASRKVDRDIVIIASSSDSVLPTKRDFDHWALQVKKKSVVETKQPTDLDPLIYLKTMQPLRSDSLVHTFEETYSSDSAIVFLKLGNGATVVIKPDNRAGITMAGCSPGGFSQFAGSARFRAENAANFIYYCGVGELNRFQLADLDNRYGLQVNPYIDDHSQQINGHCRLADFDAMLQLVYLFFKSPKVDPVAFEDWKGGKKVDMRFSQMNATLYMQSLINSIPFKRNPEAHGILDSVNMLSYLDLYKRQFSGVGNFKFFFSGDFQYNAHFRDIIIKYFGELPRGTSFNEGLDGFHADSEPYQIAGALTESRYTGIFDKAEVRLLFPGNRNLLLSQPAVLSLKIIREVLQQRIFTRLRTIEGGAYSPGVDLNIKRIPGDSISFRFVINFDSDPNQANNMVKYALQEFCRLRKEGMNLDEFRVAMANVREAISMRDNGESYARRLMNEFIDSGLLREPIDQITALDKISFEQINNCCRIFLTDEVLQKFILSLKES